MSLVQIAELAFQLYGQKRITREELVHVIEHTFNLYSRLASRFPRTSAQRNPRSGDEGRSPDRARTDLP